MPKKVLGEWLNSKGIKHIIGLIEEQWGAAPKLDYFFLKKEDGRVYIVGKGVSQVPLSELNVNSLGLYLGRLVPGGFKLSIEGSQMVGPVAKKNVVVLNQKEFRKWLQGLDIEKPGETGGFVIIAHNGDYFGCARHTRNKLLNLTPK
ncbi:hypothetical protein KY318_03855, partial [Candidatus Woesearchaeota archaeon]|nr:hypothetical protein [Candidatus Woesearchaeota archaeon]